MSIIIVIAAALCIVYGLLMAGNPNANGGMATGVGIILFIVGALLHMRKRRNEQLDAMRGKAKDE